MTVDSPFLLLSAEDGLIISSPFMPVDNGIALQSTSTADHFRLGHAFRLLPAYVLVVRHMAALRLMLSSILYSW